MLIFKRFNIKDNMTLMKLKTLNLKNIKSFVGEREFDFSESAKINTVSGINGSGKTTVFKSIILAQKIFFAEQVNSFVSTKIDYSKDLQNFFINSNSYIKLEFEIYDTTLKTASFTIKCIERKKENVSVRLDGIPEEVELIKKFWNIKSPTNLIVYIDSNRNILESDFSNENIQLKQSDSNDLALEYISHPEKIFYSTYERIIRDYIRERVIPGSPRADLPHIVSKILIRDILNYLTISNFTGLIKKNQFTLQVKRNEGSKGNSYDLRNLSSGEKTLFYIYHFICYVKNIGMLIIDEPENNLHENMLSKFVISLNDICNNESFADYIIGTAQKNDFAIKPNFAKQIKSFYKNHNLSQVFLLTHSKNLVYNNFTLGKNYVINDTLSLVDYDNYEKVLREIGLSKIINKVLFVEGKTENEILESILSPHNIKVKSLGGCSEVIETYKRYLKINREIRDVQFCFLIDRDTRTEADIDNIRSKDEVFFDEHFIVMDRHEIENYFLEAKMFYELYSKHKIGYSGIKVPLEKILEQRIKGIADNHQEKVLRKRIQNLNQNSLASIKLAISNKSLLIDSKFDYDNHIDTVFKLDNLKVTVEIIKENYNSIEEIKSNWNTEWINLCDGKVVFNEFIREVSNELEIQTKRAKKELVEIGLGSKKYEVSKIVDTILLKLHEVQAQTSIASV
ncbi:AAA family ATPase [Pontibacter sp. BT310]|uniref:AAA family ATPase n=1 Tax=Pontibacter populi TaxID=890055 RepID=A0ABS6X6Z4_9BACT|nr:MULTISPECIES: AAA family ATPase [Pontibacter]MBJ6116905.1 AAA family ATPase [Pontibacter sp. BT310]MBR0569329.1 AAA family ATPase [Microvirga sp. STS03]MBW3363758.1 AAA family ATPase [Pontibacter populi]